MHTAQLNTELKQRCNMTNSMPILHSPAKDRMRKEIAKHVNAFLAAGGKIETVTSHHNANITNFEGQRVGIIINPETAKLDIRRVNASPIGISGYRGVHKLSNGDYKAEYRGKNIGTFKCRHIANQARLDYIKQQNQAQQQA